jgi:hypothetical protein
VSWRGPVYRNPDSLVLFAILAVSSLGTATGAVPLPGSLLMGPDMFGQTAALALCLGSGVSVVGMLLRDRMDGLVVEQAGRIIAGVGCLMYAVALFTSGSHPPPPASRLYLCGWLLPISSDAVLAFGMSLGLAANCCVQWWRIHKFRDRLKREAKRIGDILEPR